MTRHRLALLIALGHLTLGPVALPNLTATARAQESAAPRPDSETQAATHTAVATFVKAHCLDCHNRETSTADLALDTALKHDIAHNAELWEKVVRKLHTRQMPPPDVPRPDEQSYRAVLARLTSQLDAAARQHPSPGRTEPLRRLTRTEYRNAVRDLLALEVDVSAWLPADESSHGFDNVTVTGLSPTLLKRYVTAARTISRLAVGRVGPSPASDTFRMRADITQDRTRVEGLPLGTRGGMLIPYHFPQDGQYVVEVRLMRDRNDEIEGLKGSHELEVLLDRERMAGFTIKPPPRGESDRLVDAELKARFQITAGAHDVGVTFVSKPFSLLESDRQPLNVHYNFYRHPRLGPAVYQVTITGPFEATGPGETASRRRIFICRPSGTAPGRPSSTRHHRHFAARLFPSDVVGF